MRRSPAPIAKVIKSSGNYPFLTHPAEANRSHPAADAAGVPVVHAILVEVINGKKI